jgi:hypothetical protein
MYKRDGVIFNNCFDCGKEIARPEWKLRRRGKGYDTLCEKCSQKYWWTRRAVSLLNKIAAKELQ